MDGTMVTLPIALVSLILAADLPTAPPSPYDWPMAAKNYENTRYSELDQINAENVKTLKPAWTFDTGIHRGQEAAPIVVGKTMYVVTPWPNVLYAFDLSKPGP